MTVVGIIVSILGLGLGVYQLLSSNRTHRNEVALLESQNNTDRTRLESQYRKQIETLEFEKSRLMVGIVILCTAAVLVVAVALASRKAI